MRGPEPLGMQARAQHVARRFEQVRLHPFGQERGCVVGRDELPAPVHEDRGERFVAFEDALDRGAHRLHLRRVEVGCVVRRREAGRDQERVARPQRHVEVLGQVQHHLPARPRPTGLDEAQMARRDPRIGCQVQLTEPASGAPIPEQHADRRGVISHPRHGTDAPCARTITYEGMDPRRS